MLLPLTVMVVNLVVEFVFGLIISLYTASNVTNEQCYSDCHNLVAKRNKKKSLFINHFRIVRNLSCNELTRGDQTVVNPSFEIVFPVK